jgi:DNA-binding CsgD family transcriptional regulator
LSYLVRDAGWEVVCESTCNREAGRRLAARYNLTRREFEVLELLSEKLTTAEFANRLFVAKVTVRTHIASILKKLGVRDRTSAVRLVEKPERSFEVNVSPFSSRAGSEVGSCRGNQNGRS